MINLKNKKILITGASGFLGKHLVDQLLKSRMDKNNLKIPGSGQYDLRKIEDCRKAIRGVDIVIHLAANVGGIGYNLDKPGELFYDNLVMGMNLIEEARKKSIEKFVQIGTICSYPKITQIPFKEENLWEGYPEETNAPYGIAKKALLVMGQAYRKQYNLNTIHLLLVNLYGPGDNFDLKKSHVIPALIKKFIDAKNKRLKKVVVWGTGKPTREFLYVEDAVKAIIMATKKYDKSEPVNIGSGVEVSIKDLVNMIKIYTGYDGNIVWNKNMPDGQLRRKLDTKNATREFRFVAKTPFSEGLSITIEWYKKLLT